MQIYTGLFHNLNNRQYKEQHTLRGEWVVLNPHRLLRIQLLLSKGVPIVIGMFFKAFGQRQP